MTWADALVEVCTRSLGTVIARSRQDSFRVYVHLDVEGGWLTGRPRLPGHLVAKLTCAGTVQPVWQQAGVPVSVGRALRIVPERTRRLVLDRDRGCRFPGCVARAHLEVHHVVHWAEGGRTDLATWPGCARSITTPTTAASSRSAGMRTCRRVGVPGPGRVPDRAGPDLRPGTTRRPAGRRRDAGAGARRSAGQVWTPSGPRLPTPDSPGTTDDAGDLEDLGYPDEDADPEPDDQDELWPGVGPPVAYQGATGEKLHSKWVTFHEGPALLL